MQQGAQERGKGVEGRFEIEREKKKSDRLGKCESEGDTCTVQVGNRRHMLGKGAVRSPDVVGAGELLLG